MSMILDKPWAVVYGPKCKFGIGLMYGLGKTRREAWEHSVLVMCGTRPSILEIDDEIKSLKKRGMVARRVAVMTLE